VKSAILLAGLAARGATRYTEPVPTRDHTERMLGAMGASLRREGRTLVLEPGELDAIDVDVPGDISSAAFWMVAAAIVPGSDVVIENVGLNPTRTGILDALTRMGAAIEVEPAEGFEPVGTVRVRGSELRGIHLGGDEIPRIIDEIPVLAIAAAFATGVTTIRDAAELRVKESDRIAAVVAGIRALGGESSAVDDGMVISGKPGLERSEADVWSLGDHRIAMAFAVAGLRVGCRARDTDCIATSYPEFGRVLGSLGASVTYEQRGAHA
jgi:3-phosphoshikimate 1-carboxyvinyltransferase